MSTTQQPEALAADHSEQNLEMVARWYMIDKDGMATLCTDREDAEKEAKNANMAWPHTAPHRAVQLVEVADVEALRTGYAAARLEIESLRARGVGPDVSGYVSEWSGGLCTSDEAMDGIAKLYAAQPAGAQQPAPSAAAVQTIPGVQWQCGPQANGFTAPQADSRPAAALDEREAFELWARPRGLQLRRNDALGHYGNIDTQRCWEGWQARAPADSVLGDAARLEFEMQHGSAIAAARKQGAKGVVMHEPLKDCPFCGGAASLHNDTDSPCWFVGCSNSACPIEPCHYADTEAEAIATWNRRTPTPVAVPLLDAARKQGANHD